eukprot:7068550-Prymnesium_polylepis.1
MDTIRAPRSCLRAESAPLSDRCWRQLSAEQTPRVPISASTAKTVNPLHSIFFIPSHSTRGSGT